MKKLLILFLIASSVIFLNIDASASHSQGGEIYYEHVSGNQYRINFKFYRYCNGISEPNSIVLSVSSTCGFNQNITLTKSSLSTIIPALPSGLTQGQTITNKCPNFATNCTVQGGAPGSEIYLYTTVVTLPANCPEFKITASISARNSNNNLSNGGNLTLSATLNTQAGAGNSSPVMLVMPSVLIPINVAHTLSLGLCEKDGDSLSVKFDPIYTGSAAAPVIVSFVSPFTAQNPFPTTGGFELISSTGQLTFTPSALGDFVYALVVEEYRNGIKIGQVKRDVQVTVTTGLLGQGPINLPPVLSDLEGVYNGPVSQKNFPSCATTTAKIRSKDLNPTGNPYTILGVFFNDGCAFPANDAPTITVSPDDYPIIDISWSPLPSSVRKNPYLLTVLVQDDYRIRGQASYTYALNVTSAKFSSAGLDVVSCNGSAVQLSGSSSEPGTTFSFVEVLPNGTTTTSSLTNPNSANPTVANPTNGQVFALTATSTAGCISLDTVTVSVVSQISAQVSATNIAVCQGDSVQVTASGGNQYLWSGGPVSDPNVADPYLSPTNPTPYQVTVSSGTCSDIATVFVTVDQPISVNLIDTVTICRNGSIQLNAQSAAGTSFTFSSDPADSSIAGANTANPTVSPQFSTDYIVKASLGACTAVDTVRVNVRGSAAPQIALSYLDQGNQTPLKFCDNADQTISVSSGSEGSEGCGANKGSLSLCAFGDTTSTIGDVNSTMVVTGDSSIFGNMNRSRRYQMLIKASELQADSLGAGNLTSISFYIDQLNNLNALKDFSIKIACVGATGSNSVNALSTLFSQAPQRVFSSTSLTLTQGKNTIFFDDAYFWTGGSNLILDICYTNSAILNKVAAIRMTPTTFSSMSVNTEAFNVNICTGCDLAGDFTLNMRPVLELTGCKKGANSLSFKYLPATGQPNSTISLLTDLQGNAVTDAGTLNTIPGQEMDSVVRFNTPSGLFPNPSLGDSAIYSYRFLISDNVGCQSEVTKEFIVYPTISSITVADTIAACFGDLITLSSSSPLGTQFSFYNASNPNDRYTVNPITVFRSLSEVFVATASNRGECSVADTFQLYIRPAYVAPYIESFNNGVIPECWDTDINGTGAWNFTSSGMQFGAANVQDHTGNSGSFAWVDGSTPVNTSNVLQTPFINISALISPKLRFWVFSNNTTTANDNVTLDVKAGNGFSFTPSILTFSGNNAGWTQYTVDLASLNLPQSIKIRFIVDETTATNPAQNDLLIDDVEIYSSVTAIDQQSELDRSIRIFPNPANDRVSIGIVRNGSAGKPMDVSILDVHGRTVTERKNVLSDHVDMDVSQLAGSVYFVRVILDGNVAVKKLVKE